MQHTHRDISRLDAALNSNVKISSASLLKQAWNITLSRGKVDLLAGYALAWLCSLVLVTLLSPIISDNVTLDEQNLPPEFVEQLNVGSQSDLPDISSYDSGAQDKLQVEPELNTQQIISLGVANVLVFLILSPIHLGVDMIGVSNVLGRKRSFKQTFQYLSFTFSLILLAITIALLVFLGLNLLILPGLYVAVGASMASILLVEYKISAGKALLSSIKAIHKTWFSVATVLGVGYFLTMIPTLLVLTQGYAHPLTIAAFAGQFWFIPLLYNVKGVLYRNLFGGDEQHSETQSDPSTPKDVKSDVFDA